MGNKEKRLAEITDKIRVISKKLDSDNLCVSIKLKLETDLENLHQEAANVRCSQNEGVIDITKLPHELRHLVKRF